MANRKMKKYDFLGGGLVTRPDDRYTNLLNDQGHFYSPAETNVQFTKIGSIQKRLGYTQNGVDIGGVNNSVWKSNSNSGQTKTVSAVDGYFIQFYYNFSAPTTNSIESVRFNLAAFGSNKSKLTNMLCFLLNDSAGNPGSAISTSANSYIDANELPTSTFNYTYFYFPAPVPVVSGTSYWVLVQMYCEVGAAAAGMGLTMRGDDSTIVPSFRWGTTNTALSTSTTFTPYSFFYKGSLPVLGIYDYRPEAAGVVTQFPMIACNGSLYYYNGTYNSVASGLASSANSLYDFSTLKNLLFSCDYATSNNQAWDGAAAATMTHGYRGTMNALAQSGSAGGPWSATSIVKVILVTALRSGGFRVSAPLSITLASTTNKIDLTGIAVDAVAAQFSFDIAATATTIYCTLPAGAIYYKVPAASLSTAGNPIANTQTTNSILPMTDATLIAGGSFESNLGYPQGYATGQVNTPKAKYMEVFQNMLATAGDPNNPSRVWFSEQLAPQVWGNGDSGTGIQGDFLDIAIDDGEQVTGLAVSDGALMVGKQTSIYRVDYTGNASDTWVVRKVHGQVGVLSNWSMQIIPEGLFFLSNRGPAICYGTYSSILPQAALIQNLFDNTSAESFNLNSMTASVACNDTTRNQVLFTVSSTGTTVRDRILSYDYEQKMFGLYDGYQANYVATIGDSNGFPVLWTGNLSGQVFLRSASYFDNGAPIFFRFSTPNLDFGDPSSWAQADFLYISGKVQVTGSLYIDLFANNSISPYRTITIDMTASNFGLGVAVRLGTVMQGLKLRFRNVDYGGNGCELHWLRLEYSESSGTRMG